MLKQLNTSYKIQQSQVYINSTKMALYKGAIATMIKKGKGSNDNFTVQCSKLNKQNEEVVILNVYDGEQNCKAVIQTNIKRLDGYLSSKEVFEIVITSFTIYTTPKKTGFQTVIVIQEFEFVKVGPVKKEHCQLLPKLEESTKTAKKEHKLSLSRTKSIKIQSFQKTTSITTERKQKQKLKLDFSQQQNEETLAQVPKDIDILSFQKIGDLYVGLFAWQLLVRVIDKSFRDFVSKQNRQIQILTIELIDRTGSIIEASCFGEQAVYLNSAIKVKGVYLIARGRIVEQQYNKKKSNKHSKYSIKLINDSSIIAVRDIAEIPYDSNNYNRIADITEEIDSNQLYNFVGILARIDPQRAIPKADKEIIMQSFRICDPTDDRVMQGIIWNRQVKLDKDLLNRSVLLKNFKVSKYKDTMNLNTSFKSEMILHDAFLDKEETCNLQRSFQEYNHNNTKKLSDLSNELKNFQTDTILSEINVWVKAIMLGAKWYYDSCPKCKKTATAFSICINCSHPVEECVKRLLLTVELCDETGSIFVTAFEDTASVFLRNATTQDLLSMDQLGRKSFGDLCSFESYTMKINSKRDGNGRINHQIVGRPQPLDEIKKCRMNLALIKKQIENANIINICS